MTWDAYHRRKKSLREMLALADDRRDLTLVQLLDIVDDRREVFADETEALFELQMTWFQRLSGQVDRRLVDGSESPELIAVTAWVDTAADLPGLRALLDAHRDEPALRTAFAKEASFLAASAGAPAHGERLVAHGLRIQESARQTAASTPLEPAIQRRHGLMARLRDVLAA